MNSTLFDIPFSKWENTTAFVSKEINNVFLILMNNQLEVLVLFINVHWALGLTLNSLSFVVFVEICH